MGVPIPGSLADRIREAVKRLGVATNRQIQTEVGHTITAARAARAGSLTIKCQAARRKYTKPPQGGGSPIKNHHTADEKIQIGRKIIVNSTITNLLHRGELERLAPATYRYVGRTSPLTFSQRILEAVKDKTEFTVDDVFNLFYGDISVKEALHAYKRLQAGYAKRRQKLQKVPRDRQIRVGQRRVFCDRFYNLVQAGKIIRVSKGTYRPATSPTDNQDDNSA